jgi:hypothetical protein
MTEVVASLVVPAKLIFHAQTHHGDIRIHFSKYTNEPAEAPTLWRAEYEYWLDDEHGWTRNSAEHEALHTAFGHLLAELALS